MSRKTNIGKKPKSKDYGIQPYRICDKSYSEMMRTPTLKSAHNETLMKESEFAVPYGDTPDYSGMEYAAPNLYLDYDVPWMGEFPDFELAYEPWHLTFYCAVDPCWCAGASKTFTINCTHEIYTIDAYNPTQEGYFGLTWTKNTITITAIEEAKGGFYFTVWMYAKVPKGGTKWKDIYDPVPGSHEGIYVGKCASAECDAACLDDDGTMAWDDAYSDDTVAREASANIGVAASPNGPFIWAVSGTGFTLENDNPLGVTNTLTADATACGIAVITVTGCDDVSVTGRVKCTTGSWAACTDGNQGNGQCTCDGSVRYPTGCDPVYWSYLDGFNYSPGGLVRMSITSGGVLQQKCNQGSDCSVTCGPLGTTLASWVTGFTPNLNTDTKALGFQVWGC